MANPPNVVEDFPEGGPGEDGEGAGQQAAAATAQQPAANDPNTSVEAKLNLILATMANMATKADMATMSTNMATKADMATMSTNFDTLKRDMATKADMALLNKNFEKLMVAAPAAALFANTSYVVGN